MALPSWPADVAWRADGMRLGSDPTVRRTQFEDGAVRQAPAFGAALRTREIVALLPSDEALESFQRWADRHAHTWFGWRDVDGVQRRARVRGGSGGIAYAAFVGGWRRWEATLTLEGWRDDLVLAAPGRPTGVAVAASAGALAVTWAPAEDASDYAVQWRSGDQAFGAERQIVVAGDAATRVARSVAAAPANVDGLAVGDVLERSDTGNLYRVTSEWWDGAGRTYSISPRETEWVAAQGTWGGQRYVRTSFDPRVLYRPRAPQRFLDEIWYSPSATCWAVGVFLDLTGTGRPVTNLRPKWVLAVRSSGGDSGFVFSDDATNLPGPTVQEAAPRDVVCRRAAVLDAAPPFAATFAMFAKATVMEDAPLLPLAPYGGDVGVAIDDLAAGVEVHVRVVARRANAVEDVASVEVAGTPT